MVERRIKNPVEDLRWSFFVTQKNSIVDFRLDSKYASEEYWKYY